jgi:hypothetical protein
MHRPDMPFHKSAHRWLGGIKYKPAAPIVHRCAVRIMQKPFFVFLVEIFISRAERHYPDTRNKPEFFYLTCQPFHPVRELAGMGL